MEERHDYQFTGTWIPRNVHDLFDKGDINAKEAWLLATIQALDRPGDGCTASNKFLAKKCRCNVRNIQLMLSKLVRLDLIEVWDCDGRNRHMSALLQNPTKTGGAKNCAPGAQKIAPRDNILESRKDGDMFFEDLTTKESKTDPMDTLLATALAEAICKHLPGRRTNIKAYAKEFMRLRVVDKIEADTIKKVLLWFTCHMTDKYTPVAFSGETFRKKFNAIEAAMVRSGGDVVVSKEAVTLANVLHRQHGLPEDGLAEAVQRSMDNYVILTDALSLHYANSRDVGLVSHIKQAIGSQRYFLTDWFKQRYVAQKHYSRDCSPRKLEFTLDHAEFNVKMESLTRSYTGTEARWPRLRKDLGI